MGTRRGRIEPEELPAMASQAWPHARARARAHIPPAPPRAQRQQSYAPILVRRVLSFGCAVCVPCDAVSRGRRSIVERIGDGKGELEFTAAMIGEGAPY